jgi:hypothetical protein
VRCANFLEFRHGELRTNRDFVFFNNGIVYGQAGDDGVQVNNENGTFDGGDGTDFVVIDNGGNTSNVEEGV